MKSKDVARATLFLAAFFLLSSSGHSGGYEWGGFGGRSGAMGGAFIGLADDWTANYWNPAGIAQLKGQGVGIDFLSPHPTLRASNSFANLPPGQAEPIYKYTHDMFINYSGMEPTRFDKTSSGYDFYHPNGIGCYVALPEFALGAAIYSPLGYYSDWKDTISYGMGIPGTIHGKNYQSLVIIESQITIAREILPGLYAGAGAALLYDRLDRESKKTVANAGMLDYQYKFDLEDDGFGAEGLFGLLYKFSDRLSIGAVYRTGATVTLKGKAKSSLSLMGLIEDTRVKQKFRHPPTWGIGVAVKPIPEVLILTADWQRTDWSNWRTHVEFDQPGILLQDSFYDEDWKNSNRYRFGGEFIVKPNWALRAGFMYDESPMPQKSVSLAYIPDVDRKAVSLGTGLKLGDNWNLDAMGAYAWGKRHARGAEFEQEVWAGSLATSYLF